MTERSREAAMTREQAVERLYRALHLPLPGVVVAADPATFVDHVVTVARRAGYERFYELLTLALLLTMLALTGAALAKDDAVGIALAAWGTLALVPMTLLVMGDLFDRAPEPDLLAIFGVCALIPGVGCALFTTGYQLPLAAALLGLLTAMMVGLSVTIGRPFARRLGLRCRFGSALPILGSKPLHDVLRERVQSVLTSMQEQRSWGSKMHDREPRHAVDLRQELSAIGEPHLGWRWSRLEPLLGAAADTSTRRFLDTIERRAEPLLELARAALELDELCDAVALFERVAVVLPPAMGEPVASARPPSSWRRSRRPPYADVLRNLGPQLILALMIDLAGSDERADRLLARKLLRRDQPELMGLGRLAAALRPEAVDRDDDGELFVIGRPEHLVVFVRLESEEDGEERWRRVPPHVAMAQEGVAAARRARS